MSGWVLLYGVVYLLFLGGLIGLGYALQLAKEKRYRSNEPKMNVRELLVLIPFRNERDRIHPLLISLQNARKLPFQIVFIDDHSDDETAMLIQDHLKHLPITVLNLPEGRTGKKDALRYGMEQTASKYVLTLDADVYFEPSYFDVLEQLGDADMYIMPAIMHGRNVMERFFEVDLAVFNASNVALAGLLRPVFASGANLLYLRSAYSESDNFEEHRHIASGDDTFLLRTFTKHGKDVRLVSHVNLAVFTPAPETLSEVVNQRLRWIGKTRALKDNLNAGIAAFQAVLTMIFLMLLTVALCTDETAVFYMLLGGKTAVDMLLFAPHFLRIRRMRTWMLLPVYEVLFPLYTLALICMLPFYTPQWKGRKIQHG